MRAFKWIPRGSDKLSMDIFFSSSRFRVKIKLQTHDYHTNDFFYHHHMQPIAFGRVTKLNKCRCKSGVIFTAAAGVLILTAEVGLIVRGLIHLLCYYYQLLLLLKRTSPSTLLLIYSVLFPNTPEFYHTL